jgi:hypothetical protein
VQLSASQQFTTTQRVLQDALAWRPENKTPVVTSTEELQARTHALYIQHTTVLHGTMAFTAQTT